MTIQDLLGLGVPTMTWFMFKFYLATILAAIPFIVITVVAASWLKRFIP